MLYSFLLSYIGINRMFQAKFSAKFSTGFSAYPMHVDAIRKPGVEKVSDHRTIGPRKILSSHFEFTRKEKIVMIWIKGEILRN